MELLQVFAPKVNFWELLELDYIRRPGGHKPGILRDFSEHGKLREFCATSGKNCNNQSILVRHSNICVRQLLTG